MSEDLEKKAEEAIQASEDAQKVATEKDAAYKEAMALPDDSPDKTKKIKIAKEELEKAIAAAQKADKFTDDAIMAAEKAAEDAAKKAADNDKNLTQSQKEASSLQKIRDKRDDAIKKAMEDAEKAEITYQNTVFKQFGWKLNTDIRYDGAVLPAGSRSKLNKLPEETLERLEAKGDISK